eukprot:366406-Chlamydomonas_euryale.AAC.5
MTTTRGRPGTAQVMLKRLVDACTQAPSKVSHLAWAHPENGPLLAGGTSTGRVLFWEAPRPLSNSAQSSMDEDMEDMREWRQSSEMACSKKPVCALSFAPRQLGLTVAAGCADGSVHMLEADRVLAPNSWTHQCKFQAGPQCSSLSWRPFSPGVAPLIAVASGRQVDVWQYLQSIMAWQVGMEAPHACHLSSCIRVWSLNVHVFQNRQYMRVCGSGCCPVAMQRVAELPSSETGAEVSCVHWAPTMGRPCELVAAARGSAVDIVSLNGDTSSLKTELLTTLQHGEAVWRVEFNMLGTCLATATEANLVHLWKPDFVGRWLLVSVVAGSPDAAVEDEDVD